LNKITFLIDIDNTICITKGNDYANSKPILKKIKILNKLYDNGILLNFLPQDTWEEITKI